MTSTSELGAGGQLGSLDTDSKASLGSGLASLR
jgi:hypothetical protein